MHYTQKSVYEYISKINKDPIIERKTCTVSGTAFAITQKDSDFYNKTGPLIGGIKYSLPFPTLCPEERMRRRLAWRNERTLYERVCDISGKKIISMYNPDGPYVVYDQKIRRSDARDALDFGCIVDLRTSIAEQFDRLMKTTPHSSLNVANNQENSTYTNYSVDNKNTYLSYGPTENENCMYGKFINKCVHCYDCLSTYNCQRCYQGIDSHTCYECIHFVNCNACSRCLYIEQCTNCQDCIGCIGLVGKQYYYLNKYVGKETYQEIMKQYSPINKQTITSLQKQFNIIKKQTPHPQYLIQNSEQVHGDILLDCKNCDFCFDLVNQTDCKYCRYGKQGEGSYDCVFTDPSGMFHSHEACSSLSSYSCSTFFCLDCSYAYRSVECHGCHNIFCCVGLRNKEYCIFNTQYTKEEYNKLVPIVIEKMRNEGIRGEYMPAHMSPYAYNETVAQEYYPLTKKETLQRGLTRLDEKPTVDLPKSTNILNGKDLPASIREVDDSILRCIIRCSESGRPYRIMKDELAYYRTFNIALPQIHQDERHKERLARKPKKSLHLRKCDVTGETMTSIYPAETSINVYSEKAYIQEMYG